MLALGHDDRNDDYPTLTPTNRKKKESPKNNSKPVVERFFRLVGCNWGRRKSV